jgi:hypothetical protein
LAVGAHGGFVFKMWRRGSSVAYLRPTERTGSGSRPSRRHGAPDGRVGIAGYARVLQFGGGRLRRPYRLLLLEELCAKAAPLDGKA